MTHIRATLILYMYFECGMCLATHKKLAAFEETFVV